jgi:hypothetical protein
MSNENLDKAFYGTIVETYTVKENDEGTLFYFGDQGALHRENGPAVVFVNGCKKWYLNGKLHRLSGPAIIWASDNQSDDEYYLFGRRFTMDQFYAIVKLNNTKIESGLVVKTKEYQELLLKYNKLMREYQDGDGPLNKCERKNYENALEENKKLRKTNEKLMLDLKKAGRLI